MIQLNILRTPDNQATAGEHTLSVEHCLQQDSKMKKKKKSTGGLVL